jgi:hypothetical protein
MDHVGIVVDDLVARGRPGRFRCLIRVRDSMDCAAFGAVFPEALPFRDLNPT